MERRVLVFKEHLVHKRAGSTSTERRRWTCCHSTSVPSGGQGPCPLPGPVGAGCVFLWKMPVFCLVMWWGEGPRLVGAEVFSGQAF